MHAIYVTTWCTIAMAPLVVSLSFFNTQTHLDLSGLILFEDEAELVRVGPRDQPQQKRMVRLWKLLEQS